jgi:hypothetical protein
MGFFGKGIPNHRPDSEERNEIHLWGNRYKADAKEGHDKHTWWGGSKEQEEARNHGSWIRWGK